MMGTDDKRRSIGQVVQVSAERLIVELHGRTDNFTVVGFDDIHYVARIGSFIVIPARSEYVVAAIVGLREKDPLSPGIRQDDATELNKAQSSKYLDLVPVGMLPQGRDGVFRFGVSTFPSLYADALYVLDAELDRIFEVQNACEVVPPSEGDGKVTRYNALTVGTSSVFQGYDVKVRVDEFFGGHAVVLGNTGSGKSCTVATLLQSLFEKSDEFYARGATFLILDVNGEYRQAFSELPNHIQKKYVKLEDDPHANPPDRTSESESTSVLRLPHWFMSVEEWELLLRASERTQQPVLRTALGLATLFSGETDATLDDIRNHLLASCLLQILQSDMGTPSKKDRITALLSTFHTSELNHDAVRDMVATSYGEFADIDGLTELLNGLMQDEVSLPNYKNEPFEFEHLGGALDLALLYEEAHGNRLIRDYCSQMVTRFKWIREREEFSFLRVPAKDLKKAEKDIEQFVEQCIGMARQEGKLKKQSQIVILDMNDAGDEVVEVTSAVIARLIFDRLRKADPRNRVPVNLVLEEAHRYVAERPSGYAIDAARIFQRIAKEGRKYGLFLMVASQRPSELSTTVLSQCSNFVIHRIQNPDDLKHIRQMTPFISESVLSRLPSLPKQHALIFGNAVNIPTSFRVRDVHPKPKSDDAAIRDLWFHAEEKEAEWEVT